MMLFGVVGKFDRYKVVKNYKFGFRSDAKAAPRKCCIIIVSSEVILHVPHYLHMFYVIVCYLDLHSEFVAPSFSLSSKSYKHDDSRPRRLQPRP